MNTTDLVAVQRIQNVDSRLKALMAEELAIGICHWLLYNVYGVAFIADAGPFVAKAVGTGVYSRRTLRSRGLFGPGGGYKPDYFCLTATFEAVIAESKGAFGTLSQSRQPLRKGKEQVKNVRPVGCRLRVNANRLVFATNIPIAGVHKRTKATTIVLDPPEEEQPIEVVCHPHELVRRSLGNALRMAGWAQSADRVDRGEPLLDISGASRRRVTIGESTYVVLSQFARGWRFCFNSLVWDYMTSSRDLESLQGHRNLRSYIPERVHVLPNGFGLIRVSSSTHG